MKKDDKVFFSENIVKRLSSPLTWYIIFFISILISLSIYLSQYYKCLLSSSELIDFVTDYKIPLSLFFLGTTIYGIIVAVYRTIQLEKNLKLSEKQFKLFELNISINNYFKHMEEFINMIEFLKESGLTKYNFKDWKKYNSRELYLTLYGKEFKNNLKIKTKNEIISLYKNLSHFLRNYRTSDPNLIPEEFEKIEDDCDKLKLTEILKIQEEEQHKCRKIYSLCESILDFSNEHRIQPEIKQYKSEIENFFSNRI